MPRSPSKTELLPKRHKGEGEEEAEVEVALSQGVRVMSRIIGFARSSVPDHITATRTQVLTAEDEEELRAAYLEVIETSTARDQLLQVARIVARQQRAAGSGGGGAADGGGSGDGRWRIRPEARPEDPAAFTFERGDVCTIGRPGATYNNDVQLTQLAGETPGSISR
jgi:hypothetical protein